MRQFFEILIPLALIIVLLMCMMNNNNEEAFSVGGSTCNKPDNGFKVGGETHVHAGEAKCHHNLDSFKVGGQGNGNSCHVTMIWANWCGYSNKADPEFKSLMSKHEGKEIDGCKMTFKQIEETELKADPSLMSKYKVDGFPTYFCEMNGKHETFNAIKEDDMLSKIKDCIKKLKGGNSPPAHNKPAPNKPAPNKPAHNKPAPNKPAPNKPAHKPAHNKPAHKPAHNKPHNKPAPKPGNYARDYNSVRSTIEGEILYSSCGDSEYGPLRLDSVDRNLTGIGNSIQNVMGFGDCTELEFAPVKFSTGGPQIPSMNSLLPSLAQLPAAPIDGIQGIHRPASFNSPPNGNKPGNGGNGGNGGGNGGAKKAQVTMVRADWCGFCKKAMPEWEKLKSEIHNKVVNGYHIVLRDLEQKRDEAEIKEKYSEVTGFPTYVVETTDPSGKLVKSGTFNSIEKDDMHEKIKQNLP
jgi:thiol-disulfide isomerase/thioredoxin